MYKALKTPPAAAELPPSARKVHYLQSRSKYLQTKFSKNSLTTDLSYNIFTTKNYEQFYNQGLKN